jgi:dihydrofolate reductase
LDWAAEPLSRSVVYYVACSLDGFIADADGGIGWLDEFQAAGTDFGYADFLGQVGDVVMGRKTYEQMLGFDEPYPYDGLAGWVLSSDTALSRASDSVTVTNEPAADLVERLKSTGVARIVWLVGGGSLAGSLFDAGLVDELRMFVMPVTLGEGVPMLGASHGSRRLERSLVREWPAGVVEVRYAVGDAIDRP